MAQKHPQLATTERSIAARGRRIYVDYLQNSRGKTLASAYSVRANDFAGVSAPLTWDEVDEGVSPAGLHAADVRRAARRRSATCGPDCVGSKGADLRTR